MSETNCIILDCEFNQHYEGMIKDNIVYVVKDDTLHPAEEYVCEYVDYGLVQFYTGNYEPFDDMDYNSTKKNVPSKFGYFELSTGEIVIQPKYEFTSPFYGDRAKVKLDGKFGFINPNGDVVVDIVWDESGSSFVRVGLCKVRKGSVWGFIDKNGKVVIDPQFEMVGNFELAIRKQDDSQYAALIKKEGKYGYIDSKGSYIFDPYLDDAKSFCGVGDVAYAPAMISGKWGFIDGSGDFVVDLQFDEVGEIDDFLVTEDIEKEKTLFGSQPISFYTVKKGKQWGIMDMDFNVIMPEKDVRFVEHRGKRIYIREGEISSMRKVKK